VLWQSSGGGICALESHRFLLLVLVPAYARGAMLFGIRFLPYGRPEGGTGYDLFGDPLKTRDFWGVIAVVLLSLFLGWPATRLNLVFIVTTAAVIGYYRKRMGCITGDMLGAMTEVLEAVLFLSVSAGMG